jgi:predicted transcriptional regulator with HTH domain
MDYKKNDLFGAVDAADLENQCLDLVNKGLLSVEKKEGYSYFSLTEAGVRVAEQLVQEEKPWFKKIFDFFFN